MKKSIILILVLLLTINLVGCNNNFKYEIREEYQGKIREGLAEAFIDFTKDMEKVHKDNLEKVELMDELDLADYMQSVKNDYQRLLVDINPYEEKILDIMEEQSDIMLRASTTKLDYDLGFSEFQTDKEFKVELRELKKQIEGNLEQVKIYMK